MIHTYDDATLTVEGVRYSIGARVTVSPATTGTTGAFDDQPLGGTRAAYEYSTTVTISSEGYDALLRSLDAGAAEQRRRRSGLAPPRRLPSIDLRADRRRETRSPDPSRSPGATYGPRLRASAPRQSVPPRTRRRVRVWER